MTILSMYSASQLSSEMRLKTHLRTFPEKQATRLLVYLSSLQESDRCLKS
jgi:hypothetical protein